MGTEAVTHVYLRTDSRELMRSVVGAVRDSWRRHCSQNLRWSDAEIRKYRNPEWSFKGRDVDWLDARADLVRDGMIVRMFGEKESVLLIRKDADDWVLDGDLYCDDLPKDLPGLLETPISGGACEEGFAYTFSGAGIAGAHYQDGLETCDLCGALLKRAIENKGEGVEHFRLSRCSACFRGSGQKVPFLAERMESARAFLRSNPPR